ncbi:hypothetical protein V8D89_006150 [Ganoderma adspersum]
MTEPTRWSSHLQENPRENEPEIRQLRRSGRSQSVPPQHPTPVPQTRGRETTGTRRANVPQAPSSTGRPDSGSGLLTPGGTHSVAQSERAPSEGYTDQPGNFAEVEKKLATRSMKKLWNRDEFVNMGQWCFDHGIQFEPMDEKWFLQPRFSLHIQELFNVFKRSQVSSEVWTDAGVLPTLLNSESLDEDMDYLRLKSALGTDEIHRIVSQVTREADTLNNRVTAPTEEEWRRVWNLILVPCYHHIFEADASLSKFLVRQSQDQHTIPNFKSEKNGVAFWEEHFINYPCFELYDVASQKKEEIVHATYAKKVVEPFSNALSAFYDGKEMPQNAGEVNDWVRLVRNAIAERKAHAKEIGVAMSHERFLNRLSRYPPHGRYDAAIVLHDETLFDAVHEELKRRGIPNAEERAREKFSIFECCVTQGNIRFPEKQAAKSKGKKSGKPHAAEPANAPEGAAALILSSANHAASGSTEATRKLSRRTVKDAEVANESNVAFAATLWTEMTGRRDLGSITEDPQDGVELLQLAHDDSKDGSKDEPSKLGPRKEFLVPVVLIEHKRKDTDEKKRPLEYSGNNQRLMYSTSSARFLHALGITNTPTFGITTTGSRATVSAAWCTNDPELSVPLTHVIQKDHHLLTFDVAKKKDCGDFMAFLFKFSSVCKKLGDEYLKRKTEIVNIIVDTNDDTYWTAYSQRKELGIRSKEREDKDKVKMKVVKDIDEPVDVTH